MSRGPGLQEQRQSLEIAWPVSGRPVKALLVPIADAAAMLYGKLFEQGSSLKSRSKGDMHGQAENSCECPVSQ